LGFVIKKLIKSAIVIKKLIEPAAILIRGTPGVIINNVNGYGVSH